MAGYPERPAPLRVGVLCPEAMGHIRPMCALADELERRGCRIVFFCIPDAVAILEAAGMETWVIGARHFPPGSRAKIAGRLAELQGIAARRLTFQLGCEAMEMHFEDLPAALRQSGVEAMLIDQASTAGGTVAESQALPFVTICNALPMNREPGVPPFFTGWRYREGTLARLRNRLGNGAMELAVRPAWKILQTNRRRLGLEPYAKWSDTVSALAQISQMPREFDFPRPDLPATFHHTGPFRQVQGAAEKPSGRHLIYASLGTVQNRLWSAFQAIAEACASVDAEVVLTLGDPDAALPDWSLPANVSVVPYASQLEMIAKAALVITHAGMNTVLETLSGGVPMIAIPITNDQPGVAARLVRSGAGESLPLSKLTPARLRELIERVLADESYRVHARRLQEAIRASGGVKAAADIALDALITRKPVRR
jgi:MGT family glycosyltransferase